MSLGIVTRKIDRGLPHRQTLIDGVPVTIRPGNVYYVDGDLTGGDGKSWESAFATIGAALTQAAIDIVTSGLGTETYIYIKARKMAAGATDPVSYAETITIPATLAKTHLIGVGDGAAQGNLPQIKKGSGSTALLTINAPGCTIDGLGFNGVSATGGGILLVDNVAGTATAFGTVIQNCHFKNCVGSSATNGTLGGAIQVTGGAWQIVIRNNHFYKNLADVVLLDKLVSQPQDWVIEGNIFSGPAASVDVNLMLSGGGGGAGVNGVVIRDNVFPCFPAIGSGTNHTIMVLSTSVGIISGNRFGCTGKTFKVGGDVVVPATVFLAGNWAEDALLGRSA